MTTRRNFLQAMLAACAAPAIVKAESLMKIVVPRQEIILPHEFNLGEDDFTIEMWTGKDPDEGWHHFALTRARGKVLAYKDGVLSDNATIKDGWATLAFDRSGSVKIAMPKNMDLRPQRLLLA